MTVKTHREKGTITVIEAIYKRRSIRHFLQKPIPKEDMDQILEAGMWAPSEKNAQPWKFIVVRGSERKAMVKRLKEGIMKNRKGEEGAIFGKKYEKFIPSAIYTARVLEQAPVIVFVLNTKGLDLHKDYPKDLYLMELADVQSISAAIQNMCLEAADRHIGSLWTCNVFFAYDELKEWLHEEGEMVAAIAFGYTDKEVRPMPRKPLEEVVEYRGDYPEEWKEMLAAENKE